MPSNQTILSHDLSNGVPLLPGDALPIQTDAWLGILSRQPPWMVRWGISIFFVFMVGLLGITWFIRYPDRVAAQGRLLAINPPQPLVVRTDGRLLHLLQMDGDSLVAGDLIAVLETTTDYTVALELKTIADSLLWLASNHQSYKIPFLYRSLMDKPHVSHLGELQPGYQALIAAMQTYTQYIGKGYYLQHRQMLEQDLKNIEAQQEVIGEQLSITRQEVNLAGENFKVSEKLSEQQVIAPVEYRNEAGKWLGKQLQVPQLENSRLVNAGQRLEKVKQIALLENEITQQKAIFIQALQNWLAAIATWQQQYLVYAPCKGTLVFTSFYQPGRSLQRGEAMGSVQPAHAGFFLEANLPQYNFGKLSKGQEVLIRFAAYPSEEFGTVAGRLDAVKPIPTDSGYLARIEMPGGLSTHLGKQLHYSEGLQAGIEIITDDRRLLERLLSGLRRAVQR